MLNKKHIPIINMQFAHMYKHFYKHGYNEQQIKNHIYRGFNINQSVLDSWEV